MQTSYFTLFLAGIQAINLTLFCVNKQAWCHILFSVGQQASNLKLIPAGKLELAILPCPLLESNVAHLLCSLLARKLPTLPCYQQAHKLSNLTLLSIIKQSTLFPGASKQALVTVMVIIVKQSNIHTLFLGASKHLWLSWSLSSNNLAFIPYSLVQASTCDCHGRYRRTI